MTSGKQSVAALAAALALVLLLPSVAADLPPGSPVPAPPIPSGGLGELAGLLNGTLLDPSQVDPESLLVGRTVLQVPMPLGGHAGREYSDGGIPELVARVARYVDEFDPHDDLPTQMGRAESLAVDSAHITLATLECIAFVANPDLKDSYGVDAGGAPDRVILRVPFAMTDGNSLQQGYLLIVLDLTGELECGLGSTFVPLA